MELNMNKLNTGNNFTCKCQIFHCYMYYSVEQKIKAKDSRIFFN